MTFPHRNATRRHTTRATEGNNIRTSPGCPRLIKMQQACGNYATARHLAKRGYTLEQALDLLGLPRRHFTN